ncbi:type II CRISPR RNA-guided endonuclease Cas9 [Clostridium massiliamazoniense]|uniref:type II CRISPR RNA-guided endonuclease Cas9 n=1 Tax=Clostridium massiliamazoniense TaxID=1347366 RepID=UPI000AE5D5C8|nr:type II CRISPR RNA-guided endonuclease Cas9 [Clostridium massiliamazoniense]
MKDINYRLGLDIGITSVGWSVINLDKDRIEDLGVRIFSLGENPKTGESLATQRRIARGRRRVLRRKTHRIKRVRKLLIDTGVISQTELENLYNDRSVTDVWEARIKGLDEVLSNKELAKLLITFAKRRGFKSNRKSERSDKEISVLLNDINSNKQGMIETNARTIGEFIYNKVKSSEDKYAGFRNKAGEHLMSVSRDMIVEEIEFLFKTQRDLGNKLISNELEEKYLEIFNSQRPYSKFEQLEKLVGNCTFEKELKRAPKNSISAEEFILYDNVNKLSIINKGAKRKLTEDERELIIKEAFNKKEIKYSRLRKLLDIKDNERFSTLTYSTDKDINKTENTKFIAMKGYYEIKTGIEEYGGKELWNSVKDNREMLNNIAYVITLGKSDNEISEQLKLRGVPDDIIDATLDLTFTKFMNLSVYAIEKILPFMKDGLQYNEACEIAGYDFRNIYKGEKYKKLPVINIDEIINPVVNRSLAQSRKVINSIIDKYGSPIGINIELSRELAKSVKDRDKIKKKQIKNREKSQSLKEEIKTLLKKEPTSSEILKYRLWEEQKGKCAYTQNEITINNLFEDGFCEIDHIIPFSRSFDNSLSNKVLVLCSENRNKSNRIPYEYFGHDIEKWSNFEQWVVNSGLDYKKKLNLLNRKNSKEEMNIRNIQDTQYISKFIANYINNKLEFKKSDIYKSKQKVIMINGMATAYLRLRWGLMKVREEGDKHHALDATVVAVATRGLINKISRHSKAHELNWLAQQVKYIDIETGKEINIEEYKDVLKEKFPKPWDEFKEELLLRLSNNPKEELKNNNIKTYDEEFIEKSLRPIFVSRVPNRKVKGALFEETIYSKKSFKDGKYITKKNLSDLTKKDLENIYNYKTDKKLYDSIIARMEAANYDGKKAFTEEFRKPTKNGELGPVVRSIKVKAKLPFKDGFELKKANGMVAKQGLVRVDIYYKDDKYYTVPVYRYQISSGEIPKMAVVANKPEEDWELLDESYKFKFSIYRNDLIEVKFIKKGTFFGYFDGFDRSTSAIAIKAHDSSEKSRIGIKVGVAEFNKYEVDVLGNYYKIKL